MRSQRTARPSRADPCRREHHDIQALRQRIEAAAEALIAVLDQLDAPTEDLEPDADREPWLAALEGHDRQLPWCRGGDDDRELDASADGQPEPNGSVP